MCLCVYVRQREIERSVREGGRPAQHSQSLGGMRGGLHPRTESAIAVKEMHGRSVIGGGKGLSEKLMV